MLNRGRKPPPRFTSATIRAEAIGREHLNCTICAAIASLAVQGPIIAPSVISATYNCTGPICTFTTKPLTTTTSFSRIYPTQLVTNSGHHCPASRAASIGVARRTQAR